MNELIQKGLLIRWFYADCFK